MSQYIDKRAGTWTLENPNKQLVKHESELKAITLAIDCIRLHEITFFAHTNVECKRLVIADLRSLILLFSVFLLRFWATHL